MAEEKVSIAKIVKEIILSRPAIKECLILDVINYSALARVILKELEKENIKTSTGAVKMALIRIGEDLKKERAFFEKKIKNVVAKTVIELQSDLIVITAERRAVLNNLEQLFKVMENARFFQLTQGVETFTLVLSSEEKEKVLKIIQPKAIVDLIEEQTAIVLISPEEIIETPGIIAIMTSTLSSSGVNITQIISCHKDTIFVLNRRDAPKAYQILEDMILKMRKTSK
ncbi:MAG: ACT domain-containing protein [Thermococcus sp.]|uniref:ACT domain-containing protein n=1 Tax=Thermococcus sp. TaxID=35749 RepID=UPI000F103159|nr:ACT domain-containing protein [Thermococcus sp.]RLF77136.1 MAG: ACT domain-containing protein [Thermococci archaeon]MCD6139584.1 ACT domain-containing protein [Thermococcus sp.]MCD6144505.1 ACT domain-containing protein [Thermococcus sp.]RLF81913.1 MAG: ACT domain-containing protein [Thermococci archaeon]RLF84913.1 MAG: ACT domain-containing protein [Thermococci archaeon]